MQTKNEVIRLATALFEGNVNAALTGVADQTGRYTGSLPLKSLTQKRGQGWLPHLFCV